MTDGRRAAIYVRISRDREGAGLGVQRQEDDCREQAKRLGWAVVDVYRDNDVSASDRRKKRKEYMRLLDDLRTGHVNALVVWHMDRLHRQPAELEAFIDLVDGRGIVIQTVKAGEVDPNTPTGKMVLRMLGAQARFEVEHKADRIKRKMTELAEQGRRNGGTRAFGYDQHREMITGRERITSETINDVEAKIIRELADRVLHGASLRELCRDLNERRVPTANGQQWHPLP